MLLIILKWDPAKDLSMQGEKVIFTGIEIEIVFFRFVLLIITLSKKLALLLFSNIKIL